LADDHEVVRRGLREMFADAGDVEVVGEASDGRAALDAAAAQRFDVLVLDLSLPRVSGLEVLRRVRALQPEARVLVLSMYAESQYAQRMLQAGASGYLSKDRSLAEVLDAVRVIARGHALLPQPAPGASAPTAAPHESLSKREYQVFMLVLQGRTGAEIAAELDVTASTVSTHLAKVKEKLGARTHSDIVSYAHRVGLID
jgi:DNA-binding NarL/FixJ family response regulator